MKNDFSGMDFVENIARSPLTNQGSLSLAIYPPKRTFFMFVCNLLFFPKMPF